MKRPFLSRSPTLGRQHGVTMVLVALAMVAIIAMAAISIDVITLYLAREEAQRSADTAALAAARVISLSGITGDPNNSMPTSSWKAICGGSSSPASQAASTIALQNVVGGAVANSVIVTYSAGGTSSNDCSQLPALPGSFGVNPMVTVLVQRSSLPNFFSRIWGKAGTNVSASSTTEAFNPSFSGSVVGSVVPVQPTCVKPWIVPNHDPWTLGSQSGPYCDQTGQKACNPIVKTADGTIANPGISLNGGNSQGIIGETFWLNADCHYFGANCRMRSAPQANFVPTAGSPHVELPPSLQYVPGQVLNSGAAVPSCGSSSTWETAVSGCDQSTLYQCGVQSSSTASPNMVDLTENPALSGDTTNGVQCLIHEGDPAASQPAGQDALNPYSAPSSYPFQILAGASNPLLSTGLAKDTPITSSPSIVSLPIYDDSLGNINSNGTTPVTIIGFLQVFINAVDSFGNVNVTVLNVAGCSNGAGGNTYNVGTNAVTGTSPVPTRIVTPPTP